MSRLVCTEGGFSKFWEGSVKGATFTAHFGRIGTEGHTKDRVFPTVAQANAECQKLVRQKLGKGYVEETQKAAAKSAAKMAAAAVIPIAELPSIDVIGAKWLGHAKSSSVAEATLVKDELSERTDADETDSWATDLAKRLPAPMAVGARRVLVDTGALVALINRADPDHLRCMRAIAGMRAQLVTVEPVLDQIGWLLRRYPTARRTVEGFLRGTGVGLLPDTPERTERAPKIRGDVADRLLAQAADELEIFEILTLNRLSFAGYQVASAKGKRPLELLPKDFAAASLNGDAAKRRQRAVDLRE